MSCTSSRRLHHRHNEVANIVHQEPAIRCALSQGPPVPRCELQTMVGNSSHELYYDRNIIADGSAHNNRPDIVMVDDTTKEASLIDIANPDSHKLHSTMARKPQNYADLKEDLVRTRQLKTTYTIQNSTVQYCPQQVLP